MRRRSCPHRSAIQPNYTDRMSKDRKGTPQAPQKGNRQFGERAWKALTTKPNLEPKIVQTEPAPATAESPPAAPPAESPPSPPPAN